MKIRHSLLILAPFLGGCLSAHVAQTTEWLVNSPADVQVAATPKYGVVRLSQVIVRAPYDARSIAVLRADGSVAFDALNRFAAPPLQLLKGPFMDALASSGLFKAAVGPSSSAAVDNLAEVTILKLALDCRGENARKAVVSVSVRLLDRSRAILAETAGEGASDTAENDYSAAFSRAFAEAVRAALKKL